MDTRGRVYFVLERLGLVTPERIETILALLDQDTPNPFDALAKQGLSFSAGARTRQILDYIAPRLGKNRMDRELRDYIMLPLREVGILARGWVGPKGAAIVRNYWKPKSPNNIYFLADDFLDLISLPEDELVSGVETWESATEERLTRILAAEAAALATREDQRLTSIAIDVYCSSFLPEYQVVFVDDSDGERVAPEFAEDVRRLRLPLDLSSRWPDIILNIEATTRCWIIDCVETDGEVDSVRRQEIEEAFRDRGLHVDGFTTIYRTTRRFAQRQGEMNNIALGTYLWIAEIGGAQYLKKALPDAGEIY